MTEMALVLDYLLCQRSDLELPETAPSDSNIQTPRLEALTTEYQGTMTLHTSPTRHPPRTMRCWMNFWAYINLTKYPLSQPQMLKLLFLRILMFAETIQIKTTRVTDVTCVAQAFDVRATCADITGSILLQQFRLYIQAVLGIFLDIESVESTTLACIP